MKMNFDEFKTKVKIVSKGEAKEHRIEYIKRFINVDCEYYKKNIMTLEQFSDGMCYTGYLWDCFIDPQAINIDEVNKYRAVLNEVLVFWDIHSQDRIWVEGYWKFGKDNVLYLKFKELMDNLEYLPEDIYIFDKSLKWTLVLTHEDKNGERICAKSGNI